MNENPYRLRPINRSRGFCAFSLGSEDPIVPLIDGSMFPSIDFASLSAFARVTDLGVFGPNR